MTAQAYYDAILPLIQRLDDEELRPIQQAGALIAEAIAGGHRVWVTKTSHCLHLEATTRAGGLMAVHILEDYVSIEPGDVVLAGTPVGTATIVIEPAIIAKERGAKLIVLTNVAFELDEQTELWHPSKRRLHEFADVLIDLKGPVGDGVEDHLGTGVRILPHSGVTGMVAMWMIFAEAVSCLEEQGKEPLLYQCIMVRGARERNDALLSQYHRTHVGYQPLRQEET
jgi:uncharacterized phosphosugar-binding protein